MAEICWDTPYGVVKVHLFLLYIILLLLFVEPPILFHLKNKKSRNPTRVKLKTYSGHLDHRPQAWPWSFQKVAMEIMSCQGCHGKKTSCWNNAEKKHEYENALVYMYVYIYIDTHIYIYAQLQRNIYIYWYVIYIYSDYIYKCGCIYHVYHTHIYIHTTIYICNIRICTCHYMYM